MAIVAITVLSMVYDRQKSSGSSGANITKFILVSAVVVIGLIAVGHDISTAAFVRHQSQVSSGALMFRLLVMPLLVLRALAGPFPWFVGSGYDTYVLFDYFYHVFQFALFLMFVLNWRQIMSRVTILTYSGAVFWVAGFIAGGVHTAYLALAAPFLVPQAIGTGASLWKFLAISAVCFAIANVVYVSLGLTGSGLVLGVTGY